MLAHPADLRPTALVLVGLLAAALPFALALPVAVVVPLALVSYLARAQVVVVQHNQAHLPVFRGTVGNTLFDLVLALMSGFTTPGWELQHVHGHHRHYLTPARDPAANGRFTGPGRLQRPIFAVLGSSATLLDAWRIGSELAGSGRRDPRPRLLAHQAVLWSVTVAALVANPVRGLLLVLLPQLAVRCAIFWFSYRQHDGVPATGPMDASVTHLGRANGFLLNVGHHTAHHDRPGLHWTELPRRTAELRHRIPTACIRGDAQPMPSTTASAATIASSWKP